MTLLFSQTKTKYPRGDFRSSDHVVVEC